ncbi:hypothetical protein ACIF6L_38535 [Kitasatospora sp. NPDC086009]|uniref:hypothetical protein n=1 Tax=unclassified Kitasatospora TaxID=2633591 RepID=UPI0037C836D0
MRMTHWWRRAYPVPVRESYPPVALVLADASAKTLNNRAVMICDLTAEFWRGHRRTEDYSTDSWLDYGASIPILVASLDTLTQLGPMGEVWWRYGRDGLLSLTDALDNPGDHAAYKQRQAERKAAEENRKHREAMKLRACVDCGAVPEQKARWTQKILFRAREVQFADPAGELLREVDDVPVGLVLHEALVGRPDLFEEQPGR